MRFFTSDTHFGHQNILKYEADNRPFADTDEMDEILIQRWNAVVRPGDVVFHLGDAIMGNFAKGIERMRRLNGRKVLVPGNHDGVFSGSKAGFAAKRRPEYLKVFSVIAPEFMLTTLGHDASLRVAMCHFPYEGDSHGEDRYKDKRPVDTGLPLIHGHVHGEWKHRGRQFNVGVDANNLTPVSEDEVIEWVRSL